ncbi:MAG: bacillithiol biosynthesis BshC, partial [Planctomycetota bacterium]
QIVQEPARFVAGPLLEPSLIRRFLPVRAWIGDRAEAAEEFQLRDLQKSERGRVGWVARWQASWLEKRDEEALDRLEWTLQSVLTQKEGIYESFADPKDSSTDPRLSAPRASIDALLADFRISAQPLVDLDASLAPLLRRQTRQAKAMLETFLERSERVLRNHGGTKERHRRRIVNALLPAGRPSSEVFGPLHALAHHGPALLDGVRNEIETFTFEHVAIFPR